MRRLKSIPKFIDWVDPLHDIAMEATGLSDFGSDKSYLLGLRKLLEQQDEESDLKSPVGYGWKLAFMLQQRLKAEQRFKDAPEILQNPIQRPLVITGMVRTGSTAMQHLMAGDPGRQHMQYWMSEYPQPRPPRDTWESHPDFIACHKQIEASYERVPATRAMHHNAAHLPDECGHLLAQTFTDEYWQICSRVPLYNEWYERCDMVPSYTQHKKLLQLIASNEPQKPWTIKYPVHLKHLKSFLKVYPDACVLWTHRDPASVLSSYTNMNALNRAQSAHESSIDRDDLLEEQTECWANATARAVDIRSDHSSAQFFDVHFEDFVANPVEQVRKAYQHFGFEWTDAAAQGITNWAEENPQHKHGAHKHAQERPKTYSREKIQERFSKYIDACNVSIS